jgi:hypothetical protein
MISKHVAEILAAFNNSNSITGFLKDRDKKILKLSVVSSNYTPISNMEPVIELSNGKTIYPQDLEFAILDSEQRGKTVKLGNYSFICN